MLLWQEYVEAHTNGRTWRYTQFCGHYKDFAQTLKRSMRQHRRAGEKLFIDFAGSTVPIHNGARAQVFVSAMAASSCVFACATPAQRLDDWVEGMVRALHFYGGVPQLIVPDNARAVIASPDRYEPRANETVQDLARYYGTSVLPARPRTPRDKATAESSVQVVTRWILARLAASILSVLTLAQAIARTCSGFAITTRCTKGCSNRTTVAVFPVASRTTSSSLLSTF
jgi:transposase